MDNRKILTAKIYLKELVELIEKRLHPEYGAADTAGRAKIANFYAQSLLVAADLSEEDTDLFIQLSQVREMVGRDGQDLARDEFLRADSTPAQQLIFDNIFSTDPMVQAQCQIMMHAIRSGLARRVQEDAGAQGLKIHDLYTLIMGEME